MAGPSTLAETGSITRDAPAVPFLYRALRPPLRQALVRWFDLRVDGLEHLPASGPYLIAANHHNYLDGIVLGVTVPDPISSW
jgi:1-acyl-sn-glycerol-3-phosphate acyltransferase